MLPLAGVKLLRQDAGQPAASRNYRGPRLDRAERTLVHVLS